MRTVLRSPLHGLVSKGLMLLTVTGRTSGRAYTFPVQYVERDGEILVLAGRATTKSWWRNLREPAPVGMRLRGRDVAGMALAVVDPAGVAEGLREFARRFPRSAKAIGVPVTGGEPDPAALAKAAVDNVVVRIELS
jgi:deazaflavin-dependent oxidoreductase (nitroreductase family)